MSCDFWSFAAVSFFLEDLKSDENQPPRFDFPSFDSISAGKTVFEALNFIMSGC